MPQTLSVLAIEVGSSRVKLGWFPAAGACTSDKPAGNLPISTPPLPEPSDVFRIEHRQTESVWIAKVQTQLAEWNLPGETVCVVAAVHQVAAEALRQSVLTGQPWSRTVSLTRNDIQVTTQVKERARVGIDRLLNALAANRVRRPNHPAIVVDMGTAMTVNLISSEGAFQGGAIAAGPITALAALHTATASLPRLGAEVLEQAPPPVGKSTEEAMASGAFWGAVGAVRELLERTAAACEQRPDVFLTGGASHGVAPFVRLGDRPARHMPHLVLSGIRIAADGITGS
jgi:type III pantothenate kinase